ncbi:MAG: uroporphyrinogen decarboxylase family protein [Kiritimatiellales bacterium]|nr:uroporphyrinogen decarboxylase family protein [Kiritimatiellales bacterium]
MTEATGRKLDKLDELYPQERLDASKARWEAMWNGSRNIDRYPFTFNWPHFNPYNISHPPKERIQAYLDGLLFTGQFHDDLIPSIFPGLNHATIPSMLGAVEVRLGMETGCEKLICQPQDIDRLPEPSIQAGSPAAYWVEAAGQFLEETQGRIGVHVCDMQGPFDVGAQLWSYDELIVCAYEDPDRYHRLLSLCTEAFILLWQAQKKVLGDVFVGTHFFAHDWFPASAGSTLSADGLVMCSPSFYQDFLAPYITQVADALGGTVVHSCGNFRPVLKDLCATPGVKGINASQLTIRELVDAGLDPTKTVIAYTTTQELKETMRTVRQHDLGVCLTIGDFYLLHPDESAKLDISSAEWRLLWAREEEIIKTMMV